MLNRNVLNFMACDSEFEEATIVLYGAPFDSTTSFRPGARFAPDTIRSESYGLETYSPYQDKDLTEKKIFDSGNIELPFGDTEKAINEIEKRAKEIFDAGKIPFLTGGEHSVTLGAVRAAVKKYPDLHIIHFDAHTDLREDYLGVKLSHASVIRRCHDLVGDGKIYQFGIRSGEKQEFEWAREGHTYLNPFNFNGLEPVIEKLKGKPVYFTLDMDVADTSVFPGTGTPEPGGVTFNELKDAVIKVCSKLNIKGCDAVELSPPYDTTGASTAVACKIIREMLIAIN